jgi:hypothetical protein
MGFNSAFKGLKGSFKRMEECGMDPFGSGRYLWQDIVNIIKKTFQFHKRCRISCNEHILVSPNKFCSMELFSFYS